MQDVISTDGAALIAQVIPVGLLIIAVERRALGGVRAPKTGRRRAMWIVRFWALVATVLLSVLGVLFCIVAVSTNKALDGLSAWIVIIGGVALAGVALDTTMDLTMRSFAGAFDDD